MSRTITDDIIELIDNYRESKDFTLSRAHITLFKIWELIYDSSEETNNEG